MMGTSRVVRAVARYPQIDAWLVLAGAMVVFTAFVLVAGQDVNFDGRNYHFAGAYRLLVRGQDLDLAPSQMQTWFNPLPYVPAFLLITHLPPFAATLVLCAVQALNGPMVYRIFRFASVEADPVARRMQALAATAVAVTGALFVSEAGTTFVDTILSIPLLGALLILIAPIEGVTSGSSQAWRLFAAGLMVGVSVGLKLTCVVFVPGYLVLVMLARASRGGWLRSVMLFGLGGAIGWLVTGGWWALTLWTRFDNPVFPVANNLFRSPWIDPSFRADVRFLPTRWHDLISYPVRMAVGDIPPVGAADHLIAAESYFRDSRYLVGLLCSAALAGVAIHRRSRAAIDPLARLGIFWLIGFVAWFYTFEIARYVVVLELLAGGIGMLLLARLLSHHRTAGLVASLGFAGLLIVATVPAHWGHESYSGTWFGLGDLRVLSAPRTTLVLTTSDPVAYVQPFLPPEVRMVRVGGAVPIDPAYELGRHATAMLRAADGPLRTLRETSHPDDQRALSRFGLRLVEGSCVPIAAKAEPLTSCRVERIGGS